jgi:hypothetical protein
MGTAWGSTAGEKKVGSANSLDCVPAEELEYAVIVIRERDSLGQDTEHHVSSLSL